MQVCAHVYSVWHMCLYQRARVPVRLIAHTSACGSTLGPFSGLPGMPVPRSPRAVPCWMSEEDELLCKPPESMLSCARHLTERDWSAEGSSQGLQGFQRVNQGRRHPDHGRGPHLRTTHPCWPLPHPSSPAASPGAPNTSCLRNKELEPGAHMALQEVTEPATTGSGPSEGW